jgi:hypothetical protein
MLSRYLELSSPYSLSSALATLGHSSNCRANIRARSSPAERKTTVYMFVDDVQQRNTAVVAIED